MATSFINEIPGERHIELQWRGPYVLQEEKLAQHPVEMENLPQDEPGLYIATSDHPLHGTHALTYIGETGRLVSQRLKEHEWLSWEWRLELFVVPVLDAELRRDAEKLLIFAHSPAGNAKSVSEPPEFSAPLRIWNTGRFWGLYPEISSEHEWFREPHRQPRGAALPGVAV